METFEEKSFEQQFPSLNKYIFAQETDGFLEGGNKFWREIIQEHCLDKQRVKEILAKREKEIGIEIAELEEGLAEKDEQELDDVEQERWQSAIDYGAVLAEEYKELRRKLGLE